MKSFTRSLLFALAFATGAWVPVQAQTLDQAVAAFQRADYKTAFAGFKRLADQGNPKAQSYLGSMFTDGKGVPRNDQSAYFWFLLSSAQGNSTAAKNRDIVEKNLTPQQRANAQATARVWQPR